MKTLKKIYTKKNPFSVTHFHNFVVLQRDGSVVRSNTGEYAFATRDQAIAIAQEAFTKNPRGEYTIAIQEITFHKQDTIKAI